MTAIADVEGDVPAGVLTSTRDERQVRAAENLSVVEGRPSPGLDRVTSLARRVFGVPLSTITVLQRDRAWFASEQGLGLDRMERRDTFCESTYQLDRTLVVEDALGHPTYGHLPAVADGRVRFYAGRPLRDHEGNMLGVFCLYDDQPRSLGADEMATFEEMAQWAEQELLASTELAAASDVQAVLRPSAPVVTEEWLVAGDCIPALAVGGDFFDHHVRDGSLFVGIGDVMGKGTAAALLGAGVRGALSAALPRVHAGADIGQALTSAAQGIGPDLERAGAFVTLLGGVVDLETGVLRYIDAGMGLCTLLRAEGTVERLIGDGRPVGVLLDDEWVAHETTLEPGDRLLLFSDGLLDLLEDPSRWEGPTAELLATHDEPTDLLRTLRRLTHARTGLDDVTAVAVYRRPGSAR